MRMRKRGRIFKDFVEVKSEGATVQDILVAINKNLKLILEVLCDLRVNTSDDPKKESK